MYTRMEVPTTNTQPTGAATDLAQYIYRQELAYTLTRPPKIGVHQGRCACTARHPALPRKKGYPTKTNQNKFIQEKIDWQPTFNQETGMLVLVTFIHVHCESTD